MSKAMIDEAIQDAKDAKDRVKAEKAYNDSLTTIPKPAPAPAKKMAKGGVTRADGCVSKGHTRGKMV